MERPITTTAVQQKGKKNKIKTISKEEDKKASMSWTPST